jgi:cyclophilin family peptidyl-prolyl cis-trans isomerase
MANVGVNTNGSQFNVSFSPSPHLNGRSVVFGRLTAGSEVLDRVEKVFAYKGSPITDIVISSCGVL